MTRKPKALLLLALGALMFGAAASAQTTVTFDASSNLPAGWVAGITGAGAAKWEIVADGSNSTFQELP